MDAFESDPKIAVVGPSTSRSATKQKIRRAECCRKYWTNSQIYSFAARYVLKRSRRVIVDLPVVGGFAFFIRRSTWEELGGFDINLPHYGNESELCRRLSRAGYRVVWTQNSYIHHLGESTYSRKMFTDELQNIRLRARDYILRRYGAD